MESQKGKVIQKNKRHTGSGAPAAEVEVTFYTDPLCCWSWAMEPAWNTLQLEWKDVLRVQYKMGGLLPSWQHFKDSANAISRPSQMGPEWMHAAKISGQHINSQVWTTDPPASSYPACIAVKCVQLQSNRMGEAFLRMLWKAVLAGGRNIAKMSVLFEVATELYYMYPDFDIFMFKDDLLGEKGKEAFRKDLQETKYLNISRFPSLIIRRSDHSKVLLTGYQTYESLKTAMGLNELTI